MSDSSTHFIQDVVLETLPSVSNMDRNYFSRHPAVVYLTDGSAAIIRGVYLSTPGGRERVLFEYSGDGGLISANRKKQTEFIHKAEVALMLIIVCILIFSLILFISFLVQKIDGGLDWTWPQVISPIFVIDGFLLMFSLVDIMCWFCVDRFDYRHPAAPHRSLQRIMGHMMCAAVIALTITVTAGLSSSIPSSLCWRAYLVPWYVWAGAHCVITWAEAFIEAFGWAQMRNRSTLSLWTYRCLLMLQGACSVTAAVMVACRLDRVITVNWFVIAFPMGAGVFAAALQLMMRDHLDKDHGVMFVVMLAGIVTGVPLATIIMILSMLEGSGVKLVYAFSPIFGMIAFTLIFVCFCFALCLCDPLTTYIHAQACSSIPMHATARLTNDTYDESDEEEFLQLSTPAMSDDAHEGRLSQHEEYLLC